MSDPLTSWNVTQILEWYPGRRVMSLDAAIESYYRTPIPTDTACSGCGAHEVLYKGRSEYVCSYCRVPREAATWQRTRNR